MKRFLLYAFPIVLWMGTIFALSSQSTLPTPNVSHFDKFAHASVYGALGLLFARAFRGYGRLPWTAFALGVLAASLYGATDEVHQMFTPGRSPDVFDWVADTLGASAGAGVWLWFFLRRPIPETST